MIKDENKIMTDKIFYPKKEWSANAHFQNMEEYKKTYADSIADRDAFWAEKAERIIWSKKWDSVGKFDFINANIKWFEGGRLNMSYNCLDRHVEAGKGDRTALIWEGNNPSEDRCFSYSELLRKVQKFANVLKDLGVEKGDRVCLYMQMVP